MPTFPSTKRRDKERMETAHLENFGVLKNYPANTKVATRKSTVLG